MKCGVKALVKVFENKVWEARFRFESSVLGISLKNDIKENPKKYLDEYERVCKFLKI